MRGHGITTRLLAVFILLSLVPMAGLTALFLGQFQTALEASTLSTLAIIADKKADQIAVYLHEHAENAQSLILLPQVETLFASGPGAADAARSLRAFGARGDYRDIVLTSVGGRIVFSATHPETVDAAPGGGASELMRGHQAAIALLDTQITDVRPFSKDDDRLAVYVVTPVLRQGRLLGTLALQLDLGSMMRVATDNTGLGASGETILAQRVGGEVLYAVDLPRVSGHAFRYKIALDTAAAPMRQALAGGRGQGITQDYAGQTVVAAWRYLPDPRWGMVVKMDRREAFRQARTLRLAGGSAFLLLLTAVSLAAWRFGRSIIAPIHRLTAISRTIANGETPAKITVSGWREAEQLAEAFNTMTAIQNDSHAELERRVEQRTRQLSESNAELEQFAYVASHDLREPLRMVSSYMALLERRYGDRLDAEGHEFLGFARDGAQRMDRLILDLLAFSRIDRKGAPMVTMPLGPAVEQAVANLGISIEEAGAVVTVDEAVTGAVIVGDSVQITQLFQNLIGNAVKYRDPIRPCAVHVGAARQGDLWELRVDDTGIGIEPQFFERVFGIFQRLHTRQEFEGTGIGLAVCKKIVERHGGRIWIESAVGRGSTFFLTLKASCDTSPGAD